jgi:hypothetical protein
MSAVLDFADIKGRRAAAAAQEAKRDPLSNPFALVIARQIVDQVVLDQASGKPRSVNEYVGLMYSLSNRSNS